MDKLSEKKLLIQIVGILESIENDSITIVEAEKLLFSPRIVKKMVKEKCNDKIIKIIEEGCELEDIESIIPQKLKSNVFLLKKRSLNILKSYKSL